MRTRFAVVVAAVAALNAPASGASVSSDQDGPLPMGSEGTLIVADFDSWEEVNNIGGMFSSWTRDPEDVTQGCRLEITEDDRWGSKGLAVRLIYDVESPTIAFNGMWMFLQQVDFSPYKYFVIHIRGDREAGFTPRFKMELKNKQRNTGRHVVTGVTDQWQQFAIPLTSFRGMDNFKVMKEFTIVFDDMRCTPKIGEVYIDNIYLSK
jgi:hypothetical protein